jgi:hypothetical protein
MGREGVGGGEGVEAEVGEERVEGGGVEVEGRGVGVGDGVGEKECLLVDHNRSGRA